MKNKLKKKVLFYNGSLRMGGIERVMVDVLQGLDKNKLDITLIISDGLEELNVFEKDIPNYVKIIYLKPGEIIKKTENYKKNRNKNIFSKIMYNVMMKYEEIIKKKNLKKLSKTKYDIIIDFDMGLSKYISLFDCSKKLVWVHASIKNWYKRKDKIFRLGKRLTKYNRIVAICDEMKDEVCSLYPYLKEKIVRIYNPISFDRIINAANMKDDLNNVLVKEKYIVSVMRLTEKQKDFDTLIKCWNILKNKGIIVKLFILGGGPDKEKIQNKIQQNNLEDLIILVGNVKNPYVWIKKSEFLIHSSKYEGLPTVLIEALILGKYVISSNCPTGPKEIICSKELGELYEIGDYVKLSELIQNRIKNNKKFKIGTSLFIEKFKKENVIKEYERIIMD